MIEKGNVGIGMTDPLAKLQVNGLVGCGTWSSDGNTSMFCVRNDTNWGMKFVNPSGQKYYTRIGWYKDGADNDRGVQFYDHRDNVVRMFINGSGNVGIGRTDPGYPLDIKGSAWNKILQIRSNETNGKSVAFNTGTGYFSIQVNNSATEALFIKHDTGNVGIGTSPTKAKLQVNGYGPAQWMAARYYNTNGNGWSSGSSRNLSAYFSDHIACSELQVFSDRRIKENIVDVSDNQALSMLRDIPCRYYEYRDKISKGDGKTIGFIAQEVKEVLPLACLLYTSDAADE